MKSEVEKFNERIKRYYDENDLDGVLVVEMKDGRVDFKGCLDDGSGEMEYLLHAVREAEDKFRSA